METDIKIYFKRQDVKVLGRLVLSGIFMKIPDVKVGMLTIDRYAPGTGGQIKLNTKPEYDFEVLEYLPIALAILAIGKEEIVERKSTVVRSGEIHRKGRVGPKKF